MIEGIILWGRKPRWLRFFKVMLEINGAPLKRNQDLVLRLLLQVKEAVVDLTGDYTDCKYLSRSNPRWGKSRASLMQEQDHKKEPLQSLLIYHVTSLDILSMCTKGKNPAAKQKVFQIVPLKVRSMALCLDQRH